MNSLAGDRAVGQDEPNPTGDRIESFRGPEVCKLVDITYRQLDYWARTDLLCPSISAARGSGTRREYSYTDLVELKVIKRLINGGLSLQATRRAITCLRENVGADLASANLVLAGSDSVLARSGEEVVDLVRGGQGVLDINIIPLGVLVSELEAKISQLESVRPRRRTGSAPADAGTDPAQVTAAPAVALGG
ncbi:MAG: MerR family transcriptional regulator [Actinomycetota bacterium]|nr:MerR family transcriptional regulator [Actinomycetota bacterium]